MQPQSADPASKIPPELVLEHLIAVLRSPEFADSPRLSARREWERHPEVFSARFMAAYALLLEGHPEGAMDRMAALRNTAPSSALPQIALAEAIGKARMGNRPAALESISAVEGQAQRTDVPLYWIALARASVNDDAAAIQWLEKSVRAHESY